MKIESARVSGSVVAQDVILHVIVSESAIHSNFSKPPLSFSLNACKAKRDRIGRIENHFN